MKLLLVLVLFLSGCALLSKAEDRSADTIVDGINLYCKSTDQTFRDKYRALINAKATPNAIEVVCK